MEDSTNSMSSITWDDSWEHINECVTFPISPTSLIIFLTHGLLWTKLVYVLDNMEAYKVIPLNISLMVNNISCSCPIM